MNNVVSMQTPDEEPDYPYKNTHGNWQFNMMQIVAGVRLEVGVAIDWPSGLIVITVFEE